MSIKWVCDIFSRTFQGRGGARSHATSVHGCELLLHTAADPDAPTDSILFRQRLHNGNVVDCPSLDMVPISPRIVTIHVYEFFSTLKDLRAPVFGSTPTLTTSFQSLQHTAQTSVWYITSNTMSTADNFQYYEHI